MTWKRWFAWYPVKLYGWDVGSEWDEEKLVWLCWVEWVPNPEISSYGCIYRLPRNVSLG